MAEQYLPKAMSRIIYLMDNAHSERIRLDAATWVAEMVLGKPKQEIDDNSTVQATALELAKALRLAIEHNDSASLQSGIVLEGNVRVLGEPAALMSPDEFPEDP